MKPDDLTCASTAAAAKLCRVTTAAADRWRAETIPESAGIWRKSKTRRTGGKPIIEWDLPALHAWAIERERASASKAAPVAKELDPLEREHLHRLQTENARRDGRLVDRAELDRQFAVVGHELRQHLEAVGKRHGVEVSAEIAQAMKAMRQKVNGILAETKS